MEGRRWRVQAHWKYHGEARRFDPTFADSYDDAVRFAAEMRENLDHELYEDLDVRIEEMDAAAATAEEEELRQQTMLTPERMQERLDAMYQARTTRSAEWIETEGLVAASFEIARRAQSKRRPADAEWLLSHPEFLSIERAEDDSSFDLSFDDIAAHTFDDLVEQTVEIVRRFPGVAHAYHEDRELVVVQGTFDPQALESALTDWWITQLRQEVPAGGA